MTILSILYNIIIAPVEIIFDAIFSYLQDFPGIAIIAISIVMNFLALPLYKRADAIQEEENQKTASMSKWVTHIKKTFKGDERYMILSQYYREENYKPIYALRSVFPLLLQIPFFVAAYHYLSTQTLLSGASFLFLNDLGAPDRLLHIGNMTINLLPVIMTVLNVASAFVYLKDAPLKAKIQTYGIALIFLVLLYNSPSGLVFYWTLNQVFSLCKNIFMKLIKDKVQHLIFAVGGFIIVFALALMGQLGTKTRMLFALGIIFLCCLPLILSVIDQKTGFTRKKIKPIQTAYFFLGAVFLTVFLGVMIPLAVVNSDPLEFATVYASPVSLVINNISLYAGFFIFWLGIYYFLFDTKIRNAITIILWVLSGVFLVNYLFFSGDYGIMSNYFVFDKVPEFLRSEIFINLFAVALVMVLLVFIYKKWNKAVKYAYIILLIACMSFSGIYAFKINYALRAPASEENERADTNNEKYTDSLKLSKTGKNVVVFVIDMGVGAYVPYIFDEKPELAQQFSGFSYYPNTLSYGIVTKWGSPALYGGHDYSPLALNERNDEYLCEKESEALSVMPNVFSNNGYGVTVWGAPLPSNYANTEEYYNKDIKKFQIGGDYLDEYLNIYGNSIKKVVDKNLFYYCFFRVIPTIMKPVIYNGGVYWHTSELLYDANFLTEYSKLTFLPIITETTDETSNEFLMLYNSLPHQPAILEEPNYELFMHNYSLYVNEIMHQSKTLNNDNKKLNMDSYKQIASYDANMATYIQLGNWLDYLKHEGVYDNTRIIIASDHGKLIDGQLDDALLDENTDIEGLNCVLMMKDFNSTGDFQFNDTFMMNADVPALATQGSVKSAINPFNGKEFIFANSKKDEIVLCYVDNSQVDLKEKYFDTSLGTLWQFKGRDIYNKSNWKKIQEGGGE